MVTSIRSKRPKQNGDEAGARERILDAAFTAFMDRGFAAVVRNRVSARVAVIRARDGPDNGDRLVNRDWFAVLIRSDPCDEGAQVSRLKSCEEMMPSGKEHESHRRELHIA